MSSIKVTRGLALRFSIQAFRLDVDPHALDKEFEQLFLEYNVASEEQPRVREELRQSILGVLADLIGLYETSVKLSNIHVTRELRLPSDKNLS